MPGLLAAELFRAGGANLPRAPITTLSIHLCCYLAASSKFVTMVPASVLRFGNFDHSLKILPVKLASQRRPVGIVTLKNRTLTPAARLFVECMHRTAT
jgi:DNA-binding transcriptional LysR family regulator